jgi:tetratricopeptide (TPR) repeat protein
LVAALQWSWFIDGVAAEGRVWADVALAATPRERTLLRGRVLMAAGFLAGAESDLEQMAIHAAELRALGEELDSAVLLANAFDMLAISKWARAKPHEAVGPHRESIKLYSSISDRWDEAAALAELGRTLVDVGDIDEARRTLDLAVRRARVLGEDAALGFTLDASAALAVRTGELDDASRLIDEAVRHYRSSRYQEGLASGLNTAGLIASARREWEVAREAFVEALGIVRRIGHLGAATTVLSGLARVEHARADSSRAAVLCAAAAAMRERSGAELSIHEQDELDAFRSQLRDELGVVTFEDAWAAGGALTLDRAATLAGAE